MHLNKLNCDNCNSLIGRWALGKLKVNWKGFEDNALFPKIAGTQV